MSIVGQWTLFYSFGCSGSYNQSTVTFDNNGTFKTGDGFSGQWALLSGNVHWVYDHAERCLLGERNRWRDVRDDDQLSHRSERVLVRDYGEDSADVRHREEGGTGGTSRFEWQ